MDAISNRLVELSEILRGANVTAMNFDAGRRMTTEQISAAKELAAITRETIGRPTAARSASASAPTASGRRYEQFSFQELADLRDAGGEAQYQALKADWEARGKPRGSR